MAKQEKGERGLQGEREKKKELRRHRKSERVRGRETEVERRGGTRITADRSVLINEEQTICC